MNKELNIGDYVRTKSGEITKIKSIDTNEYVKEVHVEDDVYTEYWGRKTTCLHIGTDWKSSPNIIDLIEVGDYVNGMQVTRICFDEDGGRILNLSNCILELMNEDIKSIVTKEQFESMEYKIGE